MHFETELETVYRYIDDNLDSHVERIAELVRIPSIAAEDEASTKRCAKVVEKRLREVGCQVTQMIRTPGQPVVYGSLTNSQCDKTILVYMMYDVKQVSGEKWTLLSDPFDPKLTPLKPFRRVMVGRGTYNSKGPLGAFLNAVEAIRKSRVSLPINLKFVAEGEEELGSSNLKSALESNLKLFRDCEACIDPAAGQDLDGNVQIHLGNKGSVELELECSSERWGKGGKRALHSSLAPIVESPVWRLVHALSSMTDEMNPDKVLIDGYYDNVRPPSKVDRKLIRKLARGLDEGRFRKENEVIRFLDGYHGSRLIEKLLYSTTLNIQGIYAGYTGPFFKTVIPEKACAKIEARLVPNQTPGEFAKRVKSHLKKNGYGDIKVLEYFGSDTADEWSKTDPKSGAVETVIKSYRSLGFKVQIWPLAPWSLPAHLFTKRPLKIPLLSVGVGYGSRAHAPDEYYVIEGNSKVEGLAGAEKSFVHCLYSLGSAKKLN